MDPRSPATPADLEQQLQLGREIFAEAIKSRQTLAEVRVRAEAIVGLAAKARWQIARTSRPQRHNSKLKSARYWPAPGFREQRSRTAKRQRRVGFRAGSSRKRRSRRAFSSACLVPESSDALKQRLAEWNHVKTNWLPQLNQHLRQSNMAPIVFTEIADDVE